MAGGNLEDPYSVRVKKGADETARTLGCKIHYMLLDWSLLDAPKKYDLTKV